MAVSIHEVLELNGRKPILNKCVRFFKHEGKNYAYMNRFPYRISFMKVSEGLIDILKQFNGSRTVNEVYSEYSLGGEFFELVKVFYRNSFVRESEEEMPIPESESRTLWFFPTTACNLRCVYCYASAGEVPSSLIDIEKARTWIDYFFRNLPGHVKKIRVMFHGGGEPTAAISRMKEIWQIAKNKCLELGLEAKLSSISNGNFNNDALEWLINEKANVLFSIDGPQREHDMQRPRADGKGSFEPAIQNILKLRKAGAKPGFRCTVTKINMNSLREFIDLAEKWGVAFIDFGLCNSYGRGADPDSVSFPKKELIEAYFDAWEYGYSRGIVINGYSAIVTQAARDYFCDNHSVLGFALTSEGMLSPCPEVALKNDPAAGAFITGRVNDDQTIDFFYDRIDNLRERKTENISACGNCFLDRVCNGGCSVKAYRKTGNLLEVDEEECEFLKGLSPKILNSILMNYKKFPQKLKFEHFIYKNNGNNEAFADYISFNPFNLSYN
jgi:uncharacterized protein